MTTYAISAYHHWCCEFELRSGRLCNKVCQWLATGRWFSPVPLVSSTNKIDRHDINEILLKVKHHQTNKNKQTYTQDSFTFKQFQYILYNVGIKDCVPCLYIDKSEIPVVMSVTISALKRCSVRFYLQLLGGLVSYLRYFRLFGYSGVERIVLCCVFVLFLFVLCTLSWQFLWIVHF
jgi:hypothetical protein